MTITQFEQSGCIITSDSGQTLAIDVGALTPVERLADITVNTVLVSHIHADHCNATQIKALAPKTVLTGAECTAALVEKGIACTTINAKETITVGDFTITPFTVDHGPNAPRVPEQNFGFLIEVDGVQIYFAGDMYAPSGIPVTDLEVAAALLPVGGHFTFDASAAYAFAKQFKRIDTIYPMHYEAVGPIDTQGKATLIALAEETFTIN